MCLSVPMKIEEIVGDKARCSAMGEERWVDLRLMPGARPGIGDYVQINRGFAQDIVPAAEALQAYALFEEMLAILDGE